jgi:hypothetical protein
VIETLQRGKESHMTAGKKAARTRMLRKRAAKAALTRKHRARARKAALTRAGKA